MRVKLKPGSDEFHREFRQAVSEGKETLALLVDFNRVGEIS